FLGRKCRLMDGPEAEPAIFPMPMTAFEQYMLGDDRRAYPMYFFVRLRLAGRILQEPFIAATNIALKRHVLLSATLVPSKSEPLVWQSAADQPAKIRWREKTENDAYPPVWDLDPRKTSGLGITVVTGADASEVVLQFHHSCCDGQGAFGFIHDLLIAYDNESARRPGSSSLPPLAPEKLVDRSHGNFGWSKIARMLPRQAVGLLGVRQFLMRRPASLSGRPPVAADEALPEEFPNVESLRLQPDRVGNLRKTARQNGVSLNHLLISDLFLAINDWRNKFANRSDQWIRFSIPISVRDQGDQRLPAANKVSMVFLDRRGEHFSDPLGLLRGIRDETQLIARNQLEFTFLFSLWVTRRIRGSALSAARADRCQATTLISNLGAPFARSPLSNQAGQIVSGGLRLEDFEVVAPVRAHTDMALTVAEYAGALLITMHWDRRVLSALEAKTLRDQYQQRLTHSAYS
ncbi:MAG: hypothetical protein MI861_25060, partial [Pirellulales bacterium]|nr:hypothetical protein [Pirellulales bacterium]